MVFAHVKLDLYIFSLCLLFYDPDLLDLICRTLSQKYAPLDWSDYFDQEDDVRIPDSDNVSGIISSIALPILFFIFLF